MAAAHPTPQTLMRAAAEDLALLARLHDRELDHAQLAALAAQPAGDWFAVQVKGDGVSEGFTLLDSYLAGYMASDAPAKQRDDLAVDYAEIYLTFGFRVSPTESYWLTEDHIERQEPMFEVRQWYEHYGLKIDDWRKRSDDHLVPQLQFVSSLLADERPHAWVDAGRFLDQHLLVWSQDFLGGVAQRAATPFYAGLALLTQSLLMNHRALIEQVTGEARAPVPRKPIAADTVAEGPFVPGSSPSW